MAENHDCNNRRRTRTGFTLVELLVVIAIIGILIGMLLPAVQSVREAARRTACLNNVRQMGLALLNYESSYRHLPPSFEIVPGEVLEGNNGSWSIHGRILPFVEQGNAANLIDLDVAWDAQTNTGVPTTRMPMYVCASERNDTVRIDLNTGLPRIYPQNYGFNFGTWLVYDPVDSRPGDGPFYVNSNVNVEHVYDGTSNTLAASEVKMFTSYVRNTPDLGPLPPTDPSAFENVTGSLKLGPNLHENTGHTEWCDGRAHHSGMTTVFTPNTFVPYQFNGQTYDIDVNSRQEGQHASQNTYAAITARSYHAGGVVNCVFLDGSTTSISDNIGQTVWRAIGTIASGEIADARE